MPFWIGKKKILYFKMFKSMFIYIYIYIFLSRLVWLNGNRRNWARWSEMEVNILPEVTSSLVSVENILSIKVLDLGLTWVGDILYVAIVKKHIFDQGSQQYQYHFHILALKLALKSPIRTMCLFFSLRSFHWDWSWNHY